MSSRLVVKNGRVVDPARQIDAILDVAIVDGAISEVAASIDPGSAPVLDATGLIVAPGFIDMHVHLREPGFEHAETIETGSRSAAAGGFTQSAPSRRTVPAKSLPKSAP
jgi:dihydroorotase